MQIFALLLKCLNQLFNHQMPLRNPIYLHYKGTGIVKEAKQYRLQMSTLKFSNRLNYSFLSWAILNIGILIMLANEAGSICQISIKFRHL